MILDFLANWWQPIVGFLVIISMFWYVIRTSNHPDMIRAIQKADYDRAHAYTKGKCCCGRD